MTFTVLPRSVVGRSETRQEQEIKIKLTQYLKQKNSLNCFENVWFEIKLFQLKQNCMTLRDVNFHIREYPSKEKIRMLEDTFSFSKRCRRPENVLVQEKINPKTCAKGRGRAKSYLQRLGHCRRKIFTHKYTVLPVASLIKKM